MGGFGDNHTLRKSLARTIIKRKPVVTDKTRHIRSDKGSHLLYRWSFKITNGGVSGPGCDRTHIIRNKDRI